MGTVVNLFKKIKRQRTIYKIILILGFEAAVYVIVFLSGGSKTAWPLLNLFIITLISYCCNTNLVIVSIFIAGLLMGPFMPLDTTIGVPQDISNWLARLAIYIGYGLMMKYLFYTMQILNVELLDKKLRDSFTGLYNANMFNEVLGTKLKKQVPVNVVVINIFNLDKLEKYIGEELKREIIINIVARCKIKFNISEVYSISTNELGIIIDYDHTKLLENLDWIISNEFDNMSVNGYRVNLVIKVGVAESDVSCLDAHDLVSNARVASDQGDEYNSGIYVYDERNKEEKRESLEISGLLYSELKNGNFFLVFQPVVDINKNIIYSAEVLIRWDRKDKKYIGPSAFMEIAEKTGIIFDISKWIVEESCKQLLEWRKYNINIDLSINFTTKEIESDEFRLWFISYIEKKGLPKSCIKIELTERVFSQNSEKLAISLYELQYNGFVILVDDFGTGYNSLINAVNMPVDVIKIDKYFIDRINRAEIQSMVKHMSYFSYDLNREVIAEGVETKEQFEILKTIGVDYIQGYYFSKPLKADEFESYYRSFGK